MKYYIQVLESDDQSRGAIWEVTEEIARRIDVTDHSGANTYRSKNGLNALAVLQKSFPQSTVFHELRLGPGEYYKCMARPSSESLAGLLGTIQTQARAGFTRARLVPDNCTRL